MCFLILDEQGKQIKKAAKESGLDKAVLKSWLRFYVKVKKRLPEVTNHYHRVKNDAWQLKTDAEDAVRILADKNMTADSADEKRIKAVFSDIRAKKDKLDFEFLISKADKEIHSTMESLVRLEADFLGGRADLLILQSEMENLEAMLKEALDKTKPDLFELTVFYMNHTDEELQELSYSMELERIRAVYLEEFLKPVFPAVCLLVRKEHPAASEDEVQRIALEEWDGCLKY